MSVPCEVQELHSPMYEKDGIQIWHGDCLELMPLLTGGSVDAIIADLPYGTTALKWDSIIPLEPLWEQYKRITKKNAAIVLTASQPFTSVLVMSNPSWFRYEWIWEKQKGTNFQHANKMPMKVHENILVFYRSLPTYNPQKTDLGKNYYRKGCVRNSPTKLLHPTSAALYITDGVRNGRFPRSVQKFSSEGMNAGNLHPSQKPVALMEYLIRTYTNEGDLILDNTMGSGTTLLAAKRTGRRAIGIELSREYCEVAIKRLSEEDLPLFDRQN